MGGRKGGRQEGWNERGENREKAKREKERGERETFFPLFSVLRQRSHLDLLLAPSPADHEMTESIRKGREKYS